MPIVKSTPEQIEVFETFASAKKSYCQARALWECLGESKKDYWKSPERAQLSARLEAALHQDPRDEALIEALISQEVDLDFYWENKNRYWQSFDLLRQAEEILFDTALECMKITGHGQRMIDGGVNKEMFIKAKQFHPLMYPKLIELCAKFNPNL